MSEQPKALELADRLDDEHPLDAPIYSAVLELRRQHAEIEAMRAAINGLIEVINRSNTSSGVCCCGDAMETHNDWCAGHSGVDDGDYNALMVVNHAKALLSEEKGKEAMQ